MTTWFERLMGFAERGPDQVRECATIEGEWLVSRIDGRRFRCGTLETPSLAELRVRAAGLCGSGSERIEVREVVGDAQALHRDLRNAGALFQVASQFNLLEMVSPDRSPLGGVGRYEHDDTQGPACAIAAGAGTIYRNYFVPLEGAVGQSDARQIDCLSDLGRALGNANGRLWTMQNGYVMAERSGLEAVGGHLRGLDEGARDSLRGMLRIGLQWDTQVTLGDCRHTVSQAICSALPIAYNRHPAQLWQEFARLVLEASYESVLLAGMLNAERCGSSTVYLTLVGAGAFGNPREWIFAALDRAFHVVRRAPLDVRIVSRGASDPAVAARWARGA
jgi:hypothetical protein